MVRQESQVVYSGTFDPITNGHLDIIHRTLTLFPKVVIAVAKDTGKNTLLSLDERVGLIESIVDSQNCQSKIKVIAFEGLLVSFMKSISANIIIRGIRDFKDFENESKMAYCNQQLGKTIEHPIETVFLSSSPEKSIVSSSMVKEIFQLGGDITKWVHPQVMEKLLNKLNSF